MSTEILKNTLELISRKDYAGMLKFLADHNCELEDLPYINRENLYKPETYENLQGYDEADSMTYELREMLISKTASVTLEIHRSNLIQEAQDECLEKYDEVFRKLADS